MVTGLYIIKAVELIIPRLTLDEIFFIKNNFAECDSDKSYMIDEESLKEAEEQLSYEDKQKFKGLTETLHAQLKKEDGEISVSIA